MLPTDDARIRKIRKGKRAREAGGVEEKRRVVVETRGTRRWAGEAGVPGWVRVRNCTRAKTDARRE